MTTENRTDRELWDDARGGDGGAFGLLFDRHGRAVYNHCFRLVGSWGAAEDLTQAVFLLAWRKRARVRMTTDSALPWLLSVATNVVRTHHRSTTRWLSRWMPSPRTRRCARRTSCGGTTSPTGPGRLVGTT